MSFRTILVSLGDDAENEARLLLARDLASRFEATLVGMHVLLPPLVASGLYGEAAIYAGPSLIEAHRQANAEISDRVKASFQQLCGDAGNAVWREEEGDPAVLLPAAAHAADLVICSQTRSGDPDPRRVVEHLAMGSGVPVLM